MEDSSLPKRMLARRAADLNDELRALERAKKRVLGDELARARRLQKQLPADHPARRAADLNDELRALERAKKRVLGDELARARRLLAVERRRRTDGRNGETTISRLTLQRPTTLLQSTSIFCQHSCKGQKNLTFRAGQLGRATPPPYRPQASAQTRT